MQSRPNTLLTIRAISALFCLCVLLPVAVRADNTSPVQSSEVREENLKTKRLYLLDLLFPKSAEWTRFDALPMAIDGHDAEARVREAMHAFGSDMPPEDDYKYYLPYFRRSEDGKIGLIYSGPRSQAEGELTVVWPDYPKGSPKNQDGALSLMRVGQGSAPAYTGLLTGCCADPAEVFVRGDLIDPNGVEKRVYSSEFLELPDHLISGRFPLMLSLGCTLRYSPEINDTPLTDNSPSPALGNVARKYAGIFDVTSLAAYIDKNGEIWVLIQTTPMDDAKATYTEPQMPVEVGWIEARDITNEKVNKPILDWIHALKNGHLEKGS